MATTLRERHAGHARTMDQLRRELEEWLTIGDGPVLGYNPTFVLEDREHGLEGRYVLHRDATRRSIRIFVQLSRHARSEHEVFRADRARSSVGTPCVRLASPSADASGFYNHATWSSRTRGPAGAAEGSSRTLPAAGLAEVGGPGRRRRPEAPGAIPEEAEPDAPAALELLKDGAVRWSPVSSWDQCRAFLRESSLRSWVYFARFGPSIFAWGKASGKGERVRKSGLLQQKVSGKYDRRVDYKMLEVIHGPPTVWLFETPDPVALESRLRARVGKRYCFGGIQARDRRGISAAILATFRETTHWRQQPAGTRALFDRFLDEVYFAARVHPEDGSRTFHFGDSLEPGFIERTLGMPELRPAIETVLGVQL